jgi:predicted permease
MAIRVLVLVVVAVVSSVTAFRAPAPAVRGRSVRALSMLNPAAALPSPTTTTTTTTTKLLGRNRRSMLQMAAPAAAAAAAAASSAAAINAAALRAVAKLIATCGVGVTAGKTGLLDKTALSVLSKLVFGLFQPCLLFVNVASTVAKLGGTGGPVTLLPFVSALQILIGFVVGKFVSLLIYGKDQKSEEAKQLQMCTTFGNSGPLPLVFVDALLRSHADATYLPKSVAYVSLYLLGWSPLFWIFGPAILAPEKDPSVKEDNSEKMKELASRVFSPPVLGSIFGMVVGATPFLRNLFLPASGILNPLFEAARTLGAGYLPAVLLVLAGSLTPPTPTPEEAAAAAAAPAKADAKLGLAKQIGAIYAARFLLMPTLGFALLGFAKKHLPAIAALLTDPVLVFVLLLETCMPSAQNSTVILQLQGNRGAAARMAQALMFIYVLGVPAISYWLVKILSLTKLA